MFRKKPKYKEFEEDLLYLESLIEYDIFTVSNLKIMGAPYKVIEENLNRLKRIRKYLKRG